MNKKYLLIASLIIGLSFSLNAGLLNKLDEAKKSTTEKVDEVQESVDNKTDEAKSKVEIEGVGEETKK